MERWFVFTNKGRKVTWAETAEAAKVKAEKAGFEVKYVMPAPSALEQYESEQPGRPKLRKRRK